MGFSLLRFGFFIMKKYYNRKTGCWVYMKKLKSGKMKIVRVIKRRK